MPVKTKLKGESIIVAGINVGTKKKRKGYTDWQPSDIFALVLEAAEVKMTTCGAGLSAKQSLYRTVEMDEIPEDAILPDGWELPDHTNTPGLTNILKVNDDGTLTTPEAQALDCLSCVYKHLNQALIFSYEAKRGDDESCWKMVAHLKEASRESINYFKDFSDKINDFADSLYENNHANRALVAVNGAYVTLIESVQGYTMHAALAVGYLARAEEELIESCPSIVKKISKVRRVLMGQGSNEKWSFQGIRDIIDSITKVC